MWNIESEFTVRLGGNLYINVPNLVVFKGTPLFRMRRSDDGMLGIDFEVFNAKGECVATFAKSIVVFGDEAQYEISSGHETYSVKERASGRVIVSVQRRGVKGAELDVNVTMYLPNGFLFQATPERTNMGGMTLVGNTFKNCANGIVVT